jgi:hypothetical protein
MGASGWLIYRPLGSLRLLPSFLAANSRAALFLVRDCNDIDFRAPNRRGRE